MVYSRAARRALRACALLLSTVVLGVAVRAQAPDTTLLALDDLLTEVEAANPTLQASLLEAATLSQMGAQVGALADPIVSVSAFPYPIVTARGAQRSQWRVEQPLPWPGTLSLRKRKADLSAEVARHETKALALDLAFEVKRAYYDLHHAHHVEAVLLAYEARLGAFAEAAAVRYEVGRGPQGAILQVQLEEQRLGERLNALAAHRTEALQTLARLTNRPDLLGDPTAVVAPGLPEAADALIALALQNRPEVRALAAAHERAAAEVALAHKAFYPDFSIGVTYTDVADREVPVTADGRDAFGVMVSARVPLQRGRLNARLEEARLREAQVTARQAALETELQTQVVILAERAREAGETVRLYRERLAPLAATTVESTLASYTTGAVDYLAFLDAERTRFQVQLAATDALHHYLVAVAALERALGVADLDEAGPARSDDPDTHPTHDLR